MALNKIEEILNTHLFISSYNRAHSVDNISPELYAWHLSDVEDAGVYVDWDRPLDSAFIWGDTGQGHAFWERINRG